MRAIEFFTGNRMSGKFIDVPGTTFPVAASQPEKSVDWTVLRRIDDLMRVKATSCPLPFRRERDFWQVIDNARLSVAQGEPENLTSAILALDMLSLELCDE